MTRRLTLLMYHSIVRTEDACTRYRRSLSSFHDDLDWLQSEGYETMLLAELDERAVVPDRPVIITFDDGSKSCRTLALAELMARKMKAEFFLTTGWCNTASRLSSQDVRELAEAGMGIQSHTVTHALLSFADTAWIGIEMGASANDIEELVGKRPIALSFPGGYVSKMCGKMGPQLGYRFFCTSEPATAPLPLRSCFLPRIEVRGDGPSLERVLRPGSVARNRLRYRLLHLFGHRGHRALARFRRAMIAPKRLTR